MIGIGNPDRGDDGAGCAVARRLRSREDCPDEVRECVGDAATLMEAWRGYDDVVLVDACTGAGAPGSVHRLGAQAAESGALLRHASTHSFGVAAAIGLSRALGTLPAQLVIYAIEARHSDPCRGLSPEVAQAVDRVVHRVIEG